jgi:hypothetical protein
LLILILSGQTVGGSLTKMKRMSAHLSKIRIITHTDKKIG